MGLLPLFIVMGSVVTVGVMSAAASANLYVAQSGVDNSNCQNQATPCGTIAYAVSQAPTGATINVGIGSFGGGITIASDVTIRGETPDVDIEPPFPQAPTLTVTGAATIENMTLNTGGPNFSAIVNTGTVNLTDDILETHTNQAAVENDGGTAVLTGDTLYAEHDGIDNNDGTAILKEDTLTANTGAAVRNAQTTHPASVTAIADTIVGNSGDGISNQGGTVTLATSIVANNGTNCVGEVIDDGYNLDSGASCGFSSAAHSLSMTNPDLMELVTGYYNWGGPTPVQPPALGSPALGAIPSGTAGTDCPGTDQRGQPKPAPASACPIGAVQSVFPVVPTRAYSVLMGTTLSVPTSQGLLSGSITDANIGSQAFEAGVPLNSFPTHGTLTPNFTGSFMYTPTSGFAGTDTFSYTATDSDGFASAPNTVTISVTPSPPTIVSFSPPSGVVGGQVTITGTNLAYSPHVAFNGIPATVVHATPTALLVTIPSGHVTGDITVSTPGGSAISSHPFELTGPGLSLSVTTNTLPSATPRLRYSFPLHAINGVAPLRWKIISGALPRGLHLSVTGLVRGTPSSRDIPGNFTFTLQVRDHRSSRQGGTQEATKALVLHLS